MEQIYFVCETCGNMIEALKESGVAMMCCGKPMMKLVACSTDGVREKHVPSVSVDGCKINVVIGEVEHPMTEEHHIEWISIETKHGSQKKRLKPGDAPKATFIITDDDELIAVYEYCNIHGLWKVVCDGSKKEQCL